MKLMKTLLITSVISSLALTACSTGGKETSNSSPSPSGQVASATPKLEKLKLNLFLYGANNAVLPSVQDDFVRKQIEEKFNVELNVQNMVSSNERKLKLTSQLSAGTDAPDLFLTTGTESGDFINQGLTADLSKLLVPEKMPNYFKWVKVDEVKRFQLVNNFSRGPVPVAATSYPAYWIRQDWLDKLNLKAPTNYEELTKVMTAFSKNDPDGNGKADTYGYSQAGNGTNIVAFAPQYKKNGLIGGAFVDSQNNLHDVYSDPKIGDVLNDLREWINQGLMDPDWYLSNAANVKTKFEQGKIGMVWLGNAVLEGFESTPNSYASNLKKTIPTAKIVPIHPFPNTPNWVENIPSTTFLMNKVTIDKEPAKAERLIQILDWLSSEEGYLLTHYGIAGKHYTRNGAQITLKPDAIKTDILDKGNFLSVWNFLTPEDPQRFKLEVIDPNLTDSDRQALKTIAAWPNAQGFGTSVVPPAGVVLADFRTPLYQAHAKLLFDEKDSSKWPAIREELLTKYKGRQIFEAYVQQMRAVGLQVNDFK
ncbi:extracellular solute-binding protein [Paenibacillus koleovorans]|uniref:extracellular solute-binding protein n=1 Tax=Paenibacillus koleovorans TaxID=121608 RepID=UPI000FDC874E|nr:extracellular solute-binding protein [Paenibacillus koleovorans]